MTLVKPSRQRPRLTHAVAELFPPQGQWSEIVDADAQTIDVYRLQGERYDLAARLNVGDRLTSTLLPGLEIDLAAVFARE